MFKAREINIVGSKKNSRLNIYSLFVLSLSLVSLFACTGGKKSGSSPAVGTAILPAAPKSTLNITQPASNSLATASKILLINGTCTVSPGAKMYLGGDGNQTTSCNSDGTFSLSVANDYNGTYTYTIHEESLTLHPSDPTPITWTIASDPPPAPTLTSPVSSLTSSNSYNITGGCVAGDTVNLSGSSTQSIVCSSNNDFSFTINKTVDGSYDFALSQSVVAGPTSTSVKANWTRDTTVPQTPTIANPTLNLYTSANLNITVSGTCSNGSTLYLSGASTDNVLCSSGTFKFDLSQSANGTYNYNVIATGANKLSSPQVPFTWIVDSNIPLNPIVTSLTSPVTNNLSTITIAGTCTNGDTVFLSGASTQSVACTSSAFSFTDTQSTDNTYTYSLIEKNIANTPSGATNFTWIRDTLSPSAPLVLAPVANPFYNPNLTYTVSGLCEINSTVNVTGSDTASQTCTTGSFAFPFQQSADGTYNDTITQTDLAGNTSPSSSVQIIIITANPTAPTITSVPAVYNSNTNSVVIAGACANSNTVNLTGAATNSVVCASSAYTFTVNMSVDGTYNFSVNQTDLATNSSPSMNLQWVRDTAIPSAPAITSYNSPYTSSGSTLNLAGTCESGSTVSMSGDSTGTTACTSGGFSIAITKSSDATYNFTFSQTDIANNVSPTSAFQWIRSSATPAAPTITSPTANPSYTNTNSLTISGACTTGYTVTITDTSSGGSGASNSTTCSASSYSFNMNESTDKTYTFAITQTSLASVVSNAVHFTWVRMTVAPAALTIITPSTTTVNNNANAISISGTCVANTTVYYSDGTSSGSVACPSSTFSFNVTNSTDGTYLYTLTQADLAGNISPAVQLTWIRDTVAPLAPTISQPVVVNNTYTSSTGAITVSGDCELNSSLALAVNPNNGLSVSNPSCNTSGIYSFTISGGSNGGTYTVSLTQTDVPGNLSPATVLTWNVDTSIPSSPAPTLSGNSGYVLATHDTLSNTYYSSGAGSVTVNIPCDSASNTITFNNTNTTYNCSGTTPVATLTISESADGNYSYSFFQTNTSNGNVSSVGYVYWDINSTLPSTPNVTNFVSPYTAPGNITLSGNCLTGSTVNMTGSPSLSQTCSNSVYSFNITKSTDGTYTYSIAQTNIYGLTSNPASFTWTRNSNSLTPVTITSPTSSSYVSKTSSLVVSGTCVAGYLVTLGGSVSGSDISSPSGQSLTQTCSTLGAYSYTINKSADGVFAMTLNESFNGATSSNANITWTRDTTAPTASISPVSSNPNLTTTFSYKISSNEPVGNTVTYQCKLDSGTYASCLATGTLTTGVLTNGSHTISVIATDAIGNTQSTATTYTWTQAAYNTVALYHFDQTVTSGSATPLKDFSTFSTSGAFNSNLTLNGSTSIVNASKLPLTTTGNYQLGAGGYYSTAYNNSMSSLTNNMSVEGFVHLTAPITTGSYVTLASLNGGASPNLGWELRLAYVNSTLGYVLQFVGSLNGTTQTTVQSTSISTSTTYFSSSTTTFIYVAFTYNATTGAIAFYKASSSLRSIGTGSMGTAASYKLFIPTTAQLRLGADFNSAHNLNGSLDEFRISNTIRTISKPSAEYVAD